MLFLLPVMLQVMVQFEKMPTGISVNDAEFPIWVDFTKCVTEGMEKMPSAVEARSPEFDAISTHCKANARGKMDSGAYPRISKKSEHRSRKRAEFIIAGTDAQLRNVYLGLPDVAKINARVENMGLGVTVYDPIAHLYERYSNCVSKKYNDAPFRHRPSERVIGWKGAIEACDSLKGQLKLEAEPIMAKQADFKDPLKRKAAIDATFDGHDKMVVRAAAIDWSEPGRD